MATIETVLGPIDSAELGFTLSHEHVAMQPAVVTTHYPWLVDREAIGDFPGSVGRAVVDNQQSWSLFENRGRYRLEIVCLVIGR